MRKFWRTRVEKTMQSLESGLQVTHRVCYHEVARNGISNSNFTVENIKDEKLHETKGVR